MLRFNLLSRGESTKNFSDKQKMIFELPNLKLEKKIPQIVITNQLKTTPKSSIASQTNSERYT